MFGLFKYKEKRYGKFVFIIFALCSIAAAVASVWGGVYAVMHMSHWSKYIIISVASIFALFVGLIADLCGVIAAYIVVKFFF